MLDVVPLHPSDPKVLLRLLSGRTEPAVARCKRLSREELLADAHVSKACVVVGIDPSGLLELGRRFCHDFFDPGPPTINLYTRNCVLFATCLYVVDYCSSMSRPRLSDPHSIALDRSTFARYDHLASGRGQRLS